ncbi:PREDICTED: uncharacterized protein LOC104812450 [Tarenaya hassleriana]|uniref:uncharacterized protein LOC104812450 n=1 Tax=Tarenaya hassleriana TaxID=28532 RepID=UPI00053C9FFF|nr:PREDICTED: uncharacterized protein LOC104812450 [Tarenaya hassleriana]
MALHLARRKQRLLSNPSLIQLFSTSSSDPPPQDGNASGDNSSQSPPSSSPPQFSFSSYFGDVKSSLKQQPQQQQNVRNPFARSDANAQNPSSFTLSGNKSGGPSTSILDIKKNLAEFRRRSAVPPTGDSAVAPPSQSQPQVSFHELYKRNVASNSGDSSADPGSLKLTNMGFSAIRASLKEMKTREDVTSSVEKKGPTLSGFQNMVKVKPNQNIKSNVIGGAEAYSLPLSVFGKEMEERKAGKGKGGETEGRKTDLVKSYSADELGEKLRLLRPEGKKEEGWFSLQELNERLVKLRQWEENENKIMAKSFALKDLRAGIERLAKDDEEVKKSSLHRLDILNHLGGPNFMNHPPKDHLVENYSHPDNMSSAEKMKLKLAEVREEFKKSESDCGSSIVQVAQLTVKIKHLSSALHKKDKHSRKGLLAMVQKRKKILKYMRRKEWDDYCIALSKLGLRDNPDYKN